MKASSVQRSIIVVIKLARPAISEEAIQRMGDILRSGNLVQGPHVRQFEEALQGYLSAGNAVVVSSGTAALHLALLALDIRSGDEVLVPAFTFPATANVVEIVGAKPVLIDISPTDFNMDPAGIEKAITNRTRAVMVVHEFGQAADMDVIAGIAAAHGLPVLEDAACALGARWHERSVGTLGTLGCFSFHPRKIVTTGEGGAVTTDDDSLARRVRSLRNHGLSILGAPAFESIGLNYRMTDFQAVLGCCQISSLENEIDIRTQQVERYRDGLSSCAWVRTPDTLVGRRHTWQTFCVLLEDGLDRDRCIALLRQEGIEANLGAQALHALPFYADKYGYRPSDFPSAWRAFRQGLALPVGSHVSDRDIAFICERLSMIQQHPRH